MSNIIQSIQAKLRNLSKANKRNHQQTLTRYFQERLLFRLSISKFRDNFFLKGGALMYAIEKEVSRPTLDLDLLAKEIQADHQKIRDIFQSVCDTEYAADGVSFDSSKIETFEIVKEGNYSGIRVKVPVNLGNINQRMQIDIGFGDSIHPAPIEMNYPTLLDMEIPHIYAYSVESLVAEKFEAMIDLSEANSRMKDFYDIFRILSSKKYNSTYLKAAIAKTIEKRQTILPENHPLFTKAFASDEMRNAQWKAFLKKSNLDESILFSKVMTLITETLYPIYAQISSSRTQ